MISAGNFSASCQLLLQTRSLPAQENDSRNGARNNTTGSPNCSCSETEATGSNGPNAARERTATKPWRSVVSPIRTTSSPTRAFGPKAVRTNITDSSEPSNSDVFAQARLGLIYDKGHGVPQNPVLSYKWLDLAAAHASGRQRDYYIRLRNAVASKMSAEQIIEGQRRALAWASGRW